MHPLPSSATETQPRHTGGFSLIELVVVVAILVTLTGVALPVFLGQHRKAEGAAATSQVAMVGNAVTVGIGHLTSDGTTPIPDSALAASGVTAVHNDVVQVLTGGAALWKNGSHFCVSKSVGGIDYKFSHATQRVVTGAGVCTSADVN